MSKIFIQKLNDDNNDKFSYFAFRGETPPHNGVYIETTQEVLDGLNNRTLCWQNGEIVTNTKKEKSKEITLDPKFELAILEDKLRVSNNKAIEFAAGEITAEEFAPIKAERSAWRERIKELEKLL